MEHLNDPVKYLYCNKCGKQVSSGFYPLITEMSKDIVVRAWIECPECIQKMRGEDPEEE
jgi:endogenous inhibitor of DNA gyrase (YacG/DUF329 family)